MSMSAPAKDQQRTKEQLCDDSVTVLKTPLHYRTKYVVIDNAAWKWSKFGGKHAEHRHWSKAAWQRSKNGKDHEGLVHEHCVPRSVLTKMIIDLPTPDKKTVTALLERLCIGVIVTKEEDTRLDKAGLQRRMPDGWDQDDPFTRYHKVGIILKPQPFS